MVKWDHRIGIKHLLEVDKKEFTKEEIQEKTIKFWKIIKQKTNAKFMEDFIDNYELDYAPETMETVQDFDNLLRELYDHCDYNSIWVK